MNQFLDSPLEALAFNYVSFGIFTIVNNLWTWVAVLTAALSFWRIKAAAGAAVTSSGFVKSNDQKPSTSVSDRSQGESRAVTGVDEKPASSASVSAPGSIVETSAEQLFCNRATKGGKFKLTVYYEEYEGEQQSGVDLDGEMTVTEWSDCGGGGEWWESWERVLRLRKGEAENGWYRHQDLTALNGNVVRLWG